MTFDYCCYWYPGTFLSFVRILRRLSRYPLREIFCEPILTAVLKGAEMTRDELKKLSVIVVAGGWSDEQEISCSQEKF